MSLIVLDPGLASRIVDAGRPGTRSLGVPVGGAADRRSLAVGNALVGNPPAAPALEFALKGPRLRAECDVGCVIYGAPFEADCDGNPIAIGRTFTLRAGQELRIGGTRQGARAYLCIRGGFDLPTILASKSALQCVRKKDVLPCQPSAIHGRFLGEPPSSSPSSSDALEISVLAGLQSSWFTEDEFYGQALAVTPASDRMGLRLQGKALTMPAREMISEAVCPGAVQVTRDGQCIVLGVDGQTIGGYPKIAQVIDADLDTLGQLRPGQTIQFRKITLDKAIARDRSARESLREWVLRLRLSVDAFR